MEPRTFYPSRNTGIWYLLACVVMAGISCWGLLDPEVETIKKVVLGAILVSASVWFFFTWKNTVVPAFKKKPALTIDESGIGFPDEGVVIGWEEVANVEMIFTRGSGEIIFVKVKDRDAVASRLPLSEKEKAKWLRGGEIGITPMYLAGEEDIFELIKKYYRHYGPYPNDVWFRRPGRETWPSE